MSDAERFAAGERARLSDRLWPRPARPVARGPGRADLMAELIRSNDGLAAALRDHTAAMAEAWRRYDERGTGDHAR